MIIIAPKRYFPCEVIARSVGRSCRLILTATILVILVDDKCTFALPLCSNPGKAGVKQDFYYRLAQGKRSDMRFSVESVSGVSGKPLKINVNMSGEAWDIPQNPEGPFFLMFEGLPAGITLSTGFCVRTGVWAVSLRDIRELTLSAPAEFLGAFDVKAVLRRGAQTDIQSHTFRVEFTAPVVAHSAPDTRQQAELVARAENLFRRGELFAARSIYTELADRGSKEAVFRLAQTYDPQVLKSLFIVGLEPDIEKALELYRKASNLGATEAQERLNVFSKAAR